MAFGFPVLFTNAPNKESLTSSPMGLLFGVSLSALTAAGILSGEGQQAALQLTPAASDGSQHQPSILKPTHTSQWPTTGSSGSRDARHPAADSSDQLALSGERALVCDKKVLPDDSADEQGRYQLFTPPAPLDLARLVSNEPQSR